MSGNEYLGDLILFTSNIMSQPHMLQKELQILAARGIRLMSHRRLHFVTFCELCYHLAHCIRQSSPSAGFLYGLARM